MPVFNVLMKFDLDGVTYIAPEADKLWHVRLKCSNCGELASKITTVNASEEMEVPGGRGVANLIQKCKMCERRGNVSILEPARYTSDDAAAEEFVRMVSFECRGVEIAEFSAMNGWTVKATEAEFNDVDLEEGEWAEYDEEADESVMIVGFETKIEVSHDAGGKGKKGGKKGKKKGKKK